METGCATTGEEQSELKPRLSLALGRAPAADSSGQSNDVSAVLVPRRG